MPIFIDTEFTDLRADAKLISLGLVSGAGKEIYVEFKGWHRDECNEFVQETVPPLLDGSNPLSFAEATPLVFDWLITQGEYSRIISDSEYDWHFFQEIFAKTSEFAGEHCIRIYHRQQSIDVMFEMANFIEPPYDQIAEHAMESHFLITGRQHHALEDARALRKAYMDVERAKHSRSLKKC